MKSLLLIICIGVIVVCANSVVTPIEYGKYAIDAAYQAQTRIPTKSLTIQVHGPNFVESAEKAALALNARVLGRVGSLEDFFIVGLDDDLQTFEEMENVLLNAATIAESLSFVKQSIPQYARMLHKRTNPTDPGFSQSWHLLNTGQGGGTANIDTNVVPVWNSGNSGSGIVVSIVDDGCQHTHPDLSSAYKSSLSYDFNQNDGDPKPGLSTDNHGTSCAGCSLARANNGICSVGTAYSADFACVRLISAPVTSSTEAQALSYKMADVHIYSCSWGPSDDGKTVERMNSDVSAALEQSTTKGRGGLGSIYLFAAGNGRQSGDMCSYDGYTSSRHVICVGGIDNKGNQSPESESCPALFITSPTQGPAGTPGIYTADRTLNAGYTSGDCFTDFGGTSAATPVASGVIALLLKANSKLSHRDVLYILASKSRKVGSGWKANQVGYSHSEQLGFGMIDAKAYVDAAAQWVSVPSRVSPYDSGVKTLNRAIPDNDLNGITESITVSSNFNAEHVTVDFIAAHPSRGQLHITLTAPSGIVSTFAVKHTDNNNDMSQLFTSVRTWGEKCGGVWTMKVADEVSGSTGTWKSWKLTIYGTELGSCIPGITSCTPALDPGSVVGIVIAVLGVAGVAAGVLVLRRKPQLRNQLFNRLRCNVTMPSWIRSRRSQHPRGGVSAPISMTAPGRGRPVQAARQTPRAQPPTHAKPLPPRPQQSIAVALYNYAATKADELSLVAGEKMTVVDTKAEAQWSRVEIGGRQGLVPSNYIRIDVAPPLAPKPHRAGKLAIPGAFRGAQL